MSQPKDRIPEKTSSLGSNAEGKQAGGGVSSPVAPPSPPPVFNSDGVIEVQQTAPAKERSRKSLIALSGAVLAAVGLPSMIEIVQLILDNQELADRFAKNPTSAIIIIAMIGAAVLIYWKYQDRQTKLDLADRENARILNEAKLKYAASKDHYAVDLVPRDVPANSEAEDEDERPADALSIQTG